MEAQEEIYVFTESVFSSFHICVDFGLPCPYDAPLTEFTLQIQNVLAFCHTFLPLILFNCCSSNLVCTFFSSTTILFCLLLCNLSPYLTQSHSCLTPFQVIQSRCRLSSLVFCISFFLLHFPSTLLDFIFPLCFIFFIHPSIPFTCFLFPLLIFFFLLSLITFVICSLSPKTGEQILHL